MPRKIIILATLLGLLIGTIGMPVNVHSCAMKGEIKAAKTCGICEMKPAQEREDSRSNGCCDDRIELQHTDEASLANVAIKISAPVIIAVLSWPLLQVEQVAEAHTTTISQAHSPPLEKRNQSIYLFNSSFLI